jgi:hypothetical protein
LSAIQDILLRLHLMFVSTFGSRNGRVRMEFDAVLTTCFLAPVLLVPISPLGKLKYVGTEGGWTRYAGIGLLRLRRDAPR